MIVATTHSSLLAGTKVAEMPLCDINNSLDPSGWLLTGHSTADKNAKIVLLYDANNRPAIGVVILPAKNSFFQNITGYKDTDLEKVLYIDAIWVAKDTGVTQTLPLALYFALQRGRIWGLSNVVALIPQPNTQLPIATFMHMEQLVKAPLIERDGVKYLPVAQRLPYSMVKLYEQLEISEKENLPPYFVKEILETLTRWLERFYSGSWAQSIIEERITKEQYICSLYNLHQYVKFTTRLCARCITYSNDFLIRNHYINHLKGEINHELLIESDLKTLDADLNYLLHSHVPLSETHEFISIQESTIGFKQDSILMLACPLVAEGITANMQKDFIEHLFKVIRSWGIENPKNAAKFLSSHMHFDGGEDGHWQQVISLLENSILSEVRLQQFLCIMQNAMNGMERGFNATIDHLKLWEATPQRMH